MVAAEAATAAVGRVGPWYCRWSIAKEAGRDHQHGEGPTARLSEGQLCGERQGDCGGQGDQGWRGPAGGRRPGRSRPRGPAP